jgi:HEAT repeat protein
MTGVVRAEGPGDAGRAVSSAKQLRGEGYATDVAGLLSALHANDLAVRSEAAFLLGYAGDPAAVPTLRESLVDPEARVRVEAALALARLGEREEALPVLQQEVHGQFFADAPLRAARALAILGNPCGYGRVLEALDSPLPSNRREAIAVLPAFLPYAGQMVDGQRVDAVAVLLRGAQDAEPILRRDALTALGKVDDPRATAALAERDDQATAQE